MDLPIASPNDPPRILSDSLKRAIQDAIADIPQDKRGALSAGATLEGAEVSFGQRFGHNWTVGAYGAYSWSGQKSAGVRFSGAW